MLYFLQLFKTSYNVVVFQLDKNTRGAEVLLPTSSSTSSNNPRNAAFLSDPKAFRESQCGDAYDIMKITFLIDALSGTQRVGFFGDDVEKWPLVQAYALQDFGEHGFLTLKKQVVNLKKEAEFMFAEFDTHSAAG